jgi:hypothetical protein
MAQCLRSSSIARSLASTEQKRPRISAAFLYFERDFPAEARGNRLSGGA